MRFFMFIFVLMGALGVGACSKADFQDSKIKDRERKPVIREDTSAKPVQDESGKGVVDNKDGQSPDDYPPVTDTDKAPGDKYQDDKSPEKPDDGKSPEKPDDNKPPKKPDENRPPEYPEDSKPPSDKPGDSGDPAKDEDNDNDDVVDGGKDNDAGKDPSLCRGKNDFFISENAMSYEESHAWCEARGGVLFKHHILKYQKLHQTIQKIHNLNLWIYSWNTDNYKRACLNLHQGVAVTKEICAEQLQALCECVH